MLEKYVQQLWDQRRYSLLLWPLSLLYFTVISLRRTAYRLGIFTSKVCPVPIVVVGNITVGGTGKTPLVIYLCELLKAKSYKPGIVSRGYGGTLRHGVCRVAADSDVGLVGDEALLLANRLSTPVVIGRSRTAALEYLLLNHDIDIIISDDGLQHYAMCRDLEIAVIDGKRRFGNGFYLPAGPQRESTSRLAEVDMLVCNGLARPFEHEMALKVDGIYQINNENTNFPLNIKNCQTVHAVAGIGNPQRFFDLLRGMGLDVIEHAYPDHAKFCKRDIDFGDDLLVIMTEKDAMKCRNFVDDKHWYLKLDIELPLGFVDDFLDRIRKIEKRKKA